MNKNMDLKIRIIYNHLDKIIEDYKIDFILETIFEDDLTCFIRDMRYFAHQNRSVDYNRLFGKKLHKKQKELVLEYYKIMEENILRLLEFFKVIDNKKERKEYIGKNLLLIKQKINDIRGNIDFILSYFEHVDVVIVKAKPNP